MLNFKNKTVKLEINKLSLINHLIFINMYKVLNYGLCLGIAASLAGCGTSEHFMQDDVYNTRTPIMPPGTDLNDVTDYATYVAKKEQTEAPAERTTYVSPRQYNDYFYNSQYIFYGYSPYSSLTGLGYYGYSGYNHPNGYGFGNNLYPPIGFGSYYNYGYNPYGYYGNPYYGGYGPVYGNTSWHTPSNKPNTVSSLSNAHAGTSAGRMGSSNNGIISYPNQLIAKPNTPGYSGSGRNTMVNSSPVVTNSGRNANLNNRGSVRPVSAGRTSASAPRSGSYQRNSESTINSGTNNRTINNTNTNSNTRTSSPATRSGGSSGGSVSSPSGGSRSGGRR
jgi:hypothetical protein